MTHATRTTFDRQFDQISNDLVQMSKLVDDALTHALQALRERDTAVAKEVISRDEQVNRLRYEIEEACLTLLATQQPAAGDLRTIVAMLHIVVEMERMGDHAAGIAKTVIRMKEEPLLDTLEQIFQMGDLSGQMFRDSIQAFLDRDVERARRIASQDAHMDELYRSTFDQLVKVMVNRPDMAARATYFLWCAHNLERIADRVTNIAERVIFARTGDLNELNVG